MLGSDGLCALSSRHPLTGGGNPFIARSRAVNTIQYTCTVCVCVCSHFTSPHLYSLASSLLHSFTSPSTYSYVQVIILIRPALTNHYLTPNWPLSCPATAISPCVHRRWSIIRFHLLCLLIFTSCLMKSKQTWCCEWSNVLNYPLSLFHVHHMH